MIKDGEGKKGVRNIFYGGVLYDSFEIQKLQELEQYIEKNSILDIPSTFGESDRLKFL